MSDTKIVKPITIDCRKEGHHELYEYILAYAEKHTKGKPATAVLDIINDHKNASLSKSQTLLISGQILSAS